MRHRQVSVAILALLTLIMAAAVPVYSQFKVLYNFGASGGTADPCQPINSGIIAQGRDGNLYSTAPSCGSSDYGAVFKVTPSGSFAVTYEMPGDPGAPFRGLTLGTDGNFYGTTHGGGTAGDGILFKITPTGSLTVLHSFTGGSDGYTSDAPPIQGTDGNFYGISRRGGSPACG